MVNIVKDLRPRFGPVRDQGQRSTCLAFAVSDVHAVNRSLSTYLSVEYLYFHASRRNPALPPDAGISLLTASAAVQHDGQPAESAWPYLAVLPPDISQWLPPTGVSVSRARLQTLPQNVTEIRNKLNQDAPLVLALKISRNFLRPNLIGMVIDASPDPDKGHHGVIAVGHGTHLGKEMFLIRNSWGPGWGIDGYGWLSETYLSSRLIHVATVEPI